MFGYLSSIFGRSKAYETQDTTVTAIRPELSAMRAKYQKVRDCLGGEEVVKAHSDIYLPPPSNIRDPIEKARYEIYKQRATFLGITAFTQRTIVGKLVAKKPTIELPGQLEMLLRNVNGEGLEATQLLELALGETYGLGRGGFAADFTRVANESELSVADVRELSPTVTFYRAEQIKNWRVDKKTQKLMLVVVEEPYEEFDEFAVTIKAQYRVWKLINGRVKVEIWRDTTEGGVTLQDVQNELVEEYWLLLPGGKPWTEIPFAIAGSANNDWAMDEPPLYSIANVELSMFRNSADREEAAFRLGQPTPYLKGELKFDEDDDLKMKDLAFGSGRFIWVERDSEIGLVQAAPNTMIDVLEADKMKTLRFLGAMNFSQDNLGKDQTATGAVYQAMQSHSQLVTTGRNVTAAFHKALGFAGMFLGIDSESDEYEVKLNSDILDRPLGVLDMQVASSLYKDGIITWDEVREQARINDIALHDPEEAKALIEEEGVSDMGAPLPFGDQPTEDDDGPTDFTNVEQVANEVEGETGGNAAAFNG